MVRHYTLPENTRATIARQLAERLTPAAQILAMDGGRMALAEDFPISTLQLESVRSSQDNLAHMLHRTEYWHHQVRHGEVAREFATSTPIGPLESDWRVEGVFTSDIASQLDSVILWVDEAVKDDGLAELLYAPAYGLVALWWRPEAGNDVAVVVVDMPEVFTHLAYRHVYSGREFLERLRQEPFIQGTPEESPIGSSD
ncbi:MAG TPA: hypothetical protein VE974_10875 [Thermoanaerobaculia bacterium]|nr:hypothetical protein [Thermoanaerobaculia bacterium]